MLLKIGERTYPVVSIRDLSLTSVLQLQRELSTVETISRVRTWADILELNDELNQLPEYEVSEHPESVFMLALTVWACRGAAGERMSLLDACDVPMDRIEWVEEPGDRLTDRLPKSGGGGGRKARPGSASHRPGPQRTGAGQAGKGKRRR